MSEAITEVNKDTFWALIDQAKEHPGGPSEWLMERLMDLGAEQAERFDDIAAAYAGLAYQYGLWTAASVMDRGYCSDDGFIDFRNWLVGQGKDVYMAALADPDSLADGPDCREYRLSSLAHMGSCAYEELTGQDVIQEYIPARYLALVEELKRDIVYGEGVDYPYDQADIPAYLPRLCARYLMPEQVKELAQTPGCTWNLTSAEIRLARQGPKSSRVTRKNTRKKGGEAR